MSVCGRRLQTTEKIRHVVVAGHVIFLVLVDVDSGFFGGSDFALAKLRHLIHFNLDLFFLNPLLLFLFLIQLAFLDPVKQRHNPLADNKVSSNDCEYSEPVDGLPFGDFLWKSKHFFTRIV